MIRFLPRTLTTRLVVTAVALVAVVGILVGLSATLVMHNILADRLDAQVTEAARRLTGPDFDRAGRPESPIGPGAGGIGRTDSFSPQAIGTLFAVVVTSGTGTQAGAVVTQDGTRAALDEPALDRLGALPAGRQPRSVDIAGQSYRVIVSAVGSNQAVVVGLPTTDIDDTLESLVSTFGLLTLLGIGIAIIAGTGLVRHQLRPLHAVAEAAREVATQDLSSGDTSITTRVPTELADTSNEVGQVGAALNTLLDHVDTALSARHRSEQQVRQFVADASHELRTPLSTIHGYAELSRRTPDDPEVLATALNKVETEAGRMSALVEDLLLLARLDAGRPLVSDEVDLTRLLLEAVADARVLAPDHHWRLGLPDEPVMVTGDADRLHQVVTNLLNNARNHTPAGTTVTVGVSPSPDGGVRIEVHDDGPGLPPEIAEAAFERFTRGDTSRTRASGGAGLGLSLVSAITAAHGGTASVVSRPGSTTFTVALP
ncbi:MAG: HAMP domain-containing sensor histidine kinase [Propionibacteriales bacterium]|nr:HAMP domain-containing sensor histidine kinase [Propionibacteriales bacterium]